MYVWRYRTIPPNLSPLMVLKTSFSAKPPNLMTANISGYTVIWSLQMPGQGHTRQCTYTSQLIQLHLHNIIRENTGLQINTYNHWTGMAQWNPKKKQSI